MRIMNRLILALLLLGMIAFFLTINSSLLVQNVIKNYLNKQTSFHVDIGETDLRLIDGILILKDIRIANPPQYETNSLATIDLLKVSINLSSLWKREIEFEEIALSVSSVHAVREKSGTINVIDFIKQLQSLTRNGGKKTFNRSWIARRCLIKIESFAVTDYTKEPKYQHEFNYAYMKIFTDLSSYEEIIEGISKHFQGEIANYVIEELLNTLFDDQTYTKIFRKLFSPVKILFDDEENPQVFEQVHP